MIQISGLGRSYRTGTRDFMALDNLDLNINRGSFVAVVGKSGSGKSTLANLITGIDRPTSGSLHVGGTDLSTLNETGLAKWRGREVGVIFQSFQLLPTLTVLENVMIPLDFAGVSAKVALQRARLLLERVGIGDQANKLPLTLSGGQQQRVAVARSLANDPALLVADEPTGNLDTRTAHEVQTLFSELADAGKTIVLVTHERDCSRWVDRVITLVDGRIESDLPGGRTPPQGLARV